MLLYVFLYRFATMCLVSAVVYVYILQAVSFYCAYSWVNKTIFFLDAYKRIQLAFFDVCRYIAWIMNFLASVFSIIIPLVAMVYHGDFVQSWNTHCCNSLPTVKQCYSNALLHACTKYGRNCCFGKFSWLKAIILTSLHAFTFYVC